MVGVPSSLDCTSRVYRIQTVDERDSHESRHYRIEGFHGDVPPDTFISIVDMLDRYFCY